MITSDKRIKQENFGNITDYSAIRPKRHEEILRLRTLHRYVVLPPVKHLHRHTHRRAENRPRPLRRLHRIPRRHHPPRRRLNPTAASSGLGASASGLFFLCICPILSNFAQHNDKKTFHDLLPQTNICVYLPNLTWHLLICSRK